ncbi:hypothetical protein IFM89_012279 [Coptis chinensis]|uniref:WAT1-related protein n=1 Tax=Coptis chinensis TaxID=261450 RepID=A0A835HGP5_9MAGN|nr:hypothetical protein IFM89_012279 [Coptis chinensis]
MTNKKMDWSNVKSCAEKMAPYCFMVMTQLMSAICTILSKLIFTQGTSAIVFNVYQSIVASLFMALLAYFLERGTLGQSLTTSSLDYISSASQSAISNLFLAFTYIISIVSRQEKAELDTLRGIGKLLGTLISLSALQTSVIAVFLCRNISNWKLKWDLELLDIFLGGVLNCGLGSYAYIWSARKKGPLFAAAFAPLYLLLTAVLQWVILGNSMNVGSTVGSVLIVGGLYLFLWSKSKEQTNEAKDTSGL